MRETLRRMTGSAGAAWREIGSLLEASDGRLLSPLARERLRDRWRDIAHKEKQLDDRLTIGLVGGTGVGKSTLTNALAGAAISRATDRRPTTDRAVVYRHVDEPLAASFPREDLASPERTHEVDALRPMLLVDFPDFDSVEVDHARVLQRCLPHLDLTFVVVDETKYGDKVLYDTLKSFPQNPSNLFFVFNKADELEVRYGEAAQSVMEDLVGDLRKKVANFVGWSPAPERVLPLSALEAFEKRRADSAAPLPPDFAKLWELLGEFRARKRRIAAKQGNIDELKRRLVIDVRTEAIEGIPADLPARAHARLESGLAEAEGQLAMASRQVLSTVERRRLRGRRLREARPRLGFPIDLLFTFAGEWPWRRRRETAEGESGETSSRSSSVPFSDRLRAHYRPVREGLGMFVKSAHAELGDGPCAPPEEYGDVLGDEIAGAGVDQKLAIDLERRIDDVLRWRRLKNHFLPGLVVAYFLWTLVHPVALKVSEALEGDGGTGWGSVIWESLVSVLRGLDPITLVGLAVLIVALYVVTALIVRSRFTQAVEDSVTEVEAAARERVRARLVAVRERAMHTFEAWNAERSRLDRLTEEALDALAG